MDKVAKAVYFILSVLNAVCFLLSIKYAFDIYAVVDIPSIFALILLGVIIFLFFVIYMILQGFVFRVTDYVNIRLHNWYNLQHLRNSNDG